MPQFLGKQDNLSELIPITSKASICSVTRIVPILEVINEPTLPAIIMEVNVGANSKITDCLVAKPTKYFGIKRIANIQCCLNSNYTTNKKRYKCNNT